MHSYIETLCLFSLLLANIIIGESSIDFQWVLAIKEKKENVSESDHVQISVPFTVFNQLIRYHTTHKNTLLILIFEMIKTKTCHWQQ